MIMFIRASLCLILGLILVSTLASCSSAGKHAAALHSSQEREMTVGVVQKEVRQGMSQGDVAIVLGSPNIVTKDQSGTQTWVYDKIATEVSYSQDQGGIWLLIAGYGKEAGARASTQKTLTVVIKFDDKELVDKVTYHSSKF
jgi:outer membrane protein assembly factor BamE (lipoprotein component of BamABCDE complex)